MTFEQLIAVVRDWQARLTPDEVRQATESMIGFGIVDWPLGGRPSIDAVLAIAKGEAPEPAASPEPPSTPKRETRPPVVDRARALLREQLKHGPRPESSVRAAAKAAAIPERSLMVAADALGVRTQRGQWWLPG